MYLNVLINLLLDILNFDIVVCFFTVHPDDYVLVIFTIGSTQECFMHRQQQTLPPPR